jgi:hypothetical protein
MRKITYVFGFALLAAACDGSGSDQIDSEAYAQSFPKPKPVTPGSLGGPCGVNYADCPSIEIAKQRFANLERKAVTSKCTAAWGDTPEKRKRQTVWKMQVARLVNDHTGKYDQLEATVGETGYGKVFPNSGQSRVELRRNGAVVAQWIASQNDTPVPMSPSDINGKPFVDFYRGGAETVLAWFYTTNFTSFITDGMKCGDKEIEKANTGGFGHCDYWQGDCFYCTFSKYALIGIAGALSGGLAEILGGSGAIIGGAGAVAGEGISDTFGCKERCAAAECTKKGCECYNKATTPQDAKQCKDDEKMCCDNVHGYSTRGGECFGDF